MIWIVLIVGVFVIIWICALVIAAFKILTPDDKVQCPICNGVCGVELETEYDEHADWYDCDFCDATGVVSAEKAKEHAS